MLEKICENLHRLFSIRLIFDVGASTEKIPALTLIEFFGTRIRKTLYAACVKEFSICRVRGFGCWSAHAPIAELHKNLVNKMQRRENSCRFETRPSGS